MCLRVELETTQTSNGLELPRVMVRTSTIPWPPWEVRRLSSVNRGETAQMQQIELLAGVVHPAEQIFRAGVVL